MPKSGRAAKYPFNKGSRIFLLDMGLEPVHFLKSAGLPEDLYSRENPQLTAQDYFRAWRMLEEALGDFELPLELTKSFPAEAFDAPIFSALCCPDFNTAIRQLKLFKPLIAPMELELDINEKTTSVTIHCEQCTESVPRMLCTNEVTFFTRFIRYATRSEIVPLTVETMKKVRKPAEYAEYFGVEVKEGTKNRIVFHSSDAQLPFLTENNKMWKVFDEDLRKKLADLEGEASIEQRVKSALLELIPSGQVSIEHVADKLAMGKRTLQRRLKAENIGYQTVLNNTRQQLSEHYLMNTSLKSSEIAYLLGFQEISSYYRAFSSWTNMTPDQFRERGSLQSSLH
ncbi:AraC family transcriptional regulator [Photobacterium sp. OFAV2-7]|uniref:AraC family transcriptional regulator n=1 Tax=Photobacterium sp. OFAV2-7 TaxID=2917748 RepID=UPI001EF41614|nr:AraC family transcriptional regulator [Photobacterium sp. OFAV2-7]MCG7584323.1 AraC family transcriptional regulator [Photobacterium sp. OFAV2-7]